ncbi:DeoR/GlpR family DNA-binding transcription regulator [Clostridium vincentii]|uniref:Lactose phosphotransferase system repressor n=1 Tax=Clostridium vincentii TaxID=52704 RepID=A0A2T0BJP3_9CLOT|nr:DeoR/GlpR family DNA-binding transcription regulator [Clostridium vincentii]PRR84115.1 Lactose phosphotransferase system repressor [Clostridium vincentii]
MLTEERQRLILNKLEKESVLYVNDLVTYLDTSESTIRRDLNTLNKNGSLNKVHGGATSIKEKLINTIEEKVQNRQALNIEEKIIIAKYAARLIKPNDMVYLDAGTTTELMIDFITEKKAIFVTNGIVHAKKLIEKGFKTYILGGELKIITEAIVGVEAINSLRKYNFAKGFFGANGIHKERGYTTPDISEAMVKEEALNRSKEAYIICDKSKFDEISSITFGDINSATIITTLLEDKSYREFTKIKEVIK